PRQGHAALGPSPPAPPASRPRFRPPLPPPEEGARHVRRRRPRPGGRRPRLLAFPRLMRIALVDPLAYTPPYDDALAGALAEHGHAVTLLTSRFPHGPVPEPAGYDREELFAPVSTRIFRRSPLRLAAKGPEDAPDVARLLRRPRP